ncbi:Lmo0850 family protein [Bacillus testis]|uniref:Lmo0850 family protein n=1 Tax=Bacillus testis TaxID=1622072 RepID=UPI0011C9E6A8|nr:Lmo0850 family protein [Bacillus testis]
MINDIISQLQSKGIKVEKTKSRFDVFQTVFDRHAASHIHTWNEPVYSDKRVLIHTHSIPEI